MLRAILVAALAAALAPRGDALARIPVTQCAPAASSSAPLAEFEGALKRALSFRASYLTFSAAGQARVREAAAALEARAMQGFDAVDGRAYLAGEWKLEYSNNEVQIPRFGRLAPLKLGEVRQVWREDGTVDNCVRLEAPAGGAVELQLQHSAAVLSRQRPATFEISLQAVRVGAAGRGATLPLPVAPKSLGAGAFDVTYISDSLRITRGAYGELRVFSRLP